MGGISDQKFEEIMKMLAIPDAIKEIRPVDGSDFAELRSYIDTVNEILEVFGDIDIIPQGKLWLRAIRNKIIGEANEHLIIIQIPLVWDEIEYALWDYFYNFKTINKELKRLDNELSKIDNEHNTIDSDISDDEIFDGEISDD